MHQQKTDKLIPGFIECFRLLRAKQKKEYGIVVFFRTSAAIMDMLGLVAIIPVVSVLVDYEGTISSPRMSRIHELLGSPSEQNLLIALTIFAITLIWLNGLSVALATFTTQRYVKRVSADLATRVYRQYMHHPIDKFYGLTSSEFSRNVNGISERVAQGILGNSSNIIARSIQVLFIFSILTVVNYKVTLVLIFVVLGSYTGIFLTVRQRLVQMSNTQMREGRAVQQLITGSYRAYRSIFINGLFGTFETHFKEIKSEASRSAADTEIIGAIPRQVIEVIGLSLLILVSYLIGRTTENSHEFASIMALFGIAAYRLLPAAQQVYHGINRYITALTAYRKVAQDWGALSPPVEKARPAGQTELGRPCTLTLDNINYSYGNKKVLKNVSAHLELKGLIQIRGESGTGKSTLMDILTGIRQPDSGDILVNGSPLTEIGRDTWWGAISYQSQDDYIFHGTLEENIALMGKKIESARLEKIADICGLGTLTPTGKFIPGQEVKEGGVNLSGGQKNRLLLARALYKKSQIVFLDEAFSALDLDSSKQIINNLLRESPPRCYIVISHRAEELTHGSIILQLDRQ